MLTGGVHHIAFIATHSVGTEVFTGLYAGGPETTFTLSCLPPNASVAPWIGWAMLTVIPASSAEMVVGD